MKIIRIEPNLAIKLIQDKIKDQTPGIRHFVHEEVFNRGGFDLNSGCRLFYSSEKAEFALFYVTEADLLAAIDGFATLTDIFAPPAETGE